ncbi:hypothetical protein [Paracraurococcus lichenis]|uniref:Uncharacterized protein n=1 Tax=Paracraurococcus lichenis TaxID=3064888 RepID=A0ABT9E641_9PROT|nr:hypothetical protein [Paracraurococcus sp. LOR1-02]MDO9711599.1 hypothetical protein [Paracraurococcus sp. LOR1-02]
MAMPLRRQDLRRLRAAAERNWEEASRAEADRLLGIADPAARAEAYQALTARLAAAGDTLLPADHARICRSFGQVSALAQSSCARVRGPSSGPSAAGGTPASGGSARRHHRHSIEAWMRHWRSVEVRAAEAAGAAGERLGIAAARERIAAALRRCGAPNDSELLGHPLLAAWLAEARWAREAQVALQASLRRALCQAADLHDVGQQFRSDVDH